MRGFPRTRDCQRNRYRCDGWCGPAALYRWRTSDLAGLDPSSLDLRQLKRIGVELTLNTMVTDVDDAGVTHERGHIASHTVIWAAGVAASPLGRSRGAPTDHAGRVLVNQDLSVPKAPNGFVIGDLAAVTSEGKPVPGVGPAATQEGHHAARNIIRTIRR
jgi:NADH dehydrogenase